MRNATFPTKTAGRSTRWLGFVIAGAVAVLPVRAQTKPPSAPADEARPTFTVEPGFRYEPRGRMDPFTNPTPKPPANSAARGNSPAPAVTGAPNVINGSVEPAPAPEVIVPYSRPRGLKGLMLEDISVKGVVVAKDPAMTMAIIQGPGNKTYNVARKDQIFNAVIKDIRLDAVVFSPIIRRDDAGEALSVKEVRSDSVIYTKLPKNMGAGPSTLDVVRKLHPAPGEPK
jgi:hypothetical protein